MKLKNILILFYFLPVAGFAQLTIGAFGGVNVPHFVNQTDYREQCTIIDKATVTEGVFCDVGLSKYIRNNTSLSAVFWDYQTQAFVGDALSWACDTVNTKTTMLEFSDYLEFKIINKIPLYLNFGAGIMVLAKLREQGTRRFGQGYTPFTPYPNTYYGFGMEVSNNADWAKKLGYQIQFGLSYYLKLNDKFSVPLTFNFHRALNYFDNTPVFSKYCHSYRNYFSFTAGFSITKPRKQQRSECTE